MIWRRIRRCARRWAQGLVDNHIFMKRAEVDKTTGLEGDALRDLYIWYI